MSYIAIYIQYIIIKQYRDEINLVSLISGRGSNSLLVFTVCWRNVSVSFTSSSQRSRERKISQFKWEQNRGDYLASNRVLAPTLRLKPFSITDISADVAPASLDPLEFPAPCPLRVCRFSDSMLGHSVRPPDQWRVTRDLGMAPVQTHRQPHDTGPNAPSSPFQARAKIDTGVSVFKKPLRGRRGTLSQRLISQLKALIGIPKMWSADPQLSH